ncbi:MAG: quinone oxidoreductase [Hyphomicrobiales bacterium]|nr:quinone oxidoreductase [Hyphomicrobiales bacterium]MCP5002049.1 quinone oxidoreductase [Hyphomicrobiales bacterium]
MKTNVVIINEQGPADVMEIREVEVNPPGPGEVLIEQTAIGLNYMDVYQRSGHYPLALPSGLGLEAAGVVLEVGEGVSDLAKGDRVVYGPVLGAYARLRNVPAARLVKIPDGIDDNTAAAVMMKGMTVEYLMCRAYPVKAGEDVLFYAASGGVGHIAGQWGKNIGARMIGVTSGPDNVRHALENGYADAIDRKSEDIAGRVRELTGDKGVSVVFDSVGKATFEASIDSLAPRGYFMSFGSTTGEAPPVPPSLLQHKGSLYFCRPTLANYVSARDDLVHSASKVFELVGSGAIKVEITQQRPLSEIVDVHRAFEAGETTGSTILVP